MSKIAQSYKLTVVGINGRAVSGMRNCWVRTENPLVASKLAPLVRKADVS